MEGIPYIDVHTHSRASTPGVISLPNVYEHFEEIVALHQCSAGLHPWYLNNAAFDYELLKETVKLPNVLAVGECGLDKVIATDLAVQQKYFLLQVELAMKLNKPLIIHCVQAFSEITNLLKQNAVNVPVVFHGFNRKATIARQLLSDGYYLSYGAGLKYVHVQEAIANTPDDRYFLETDDGEIDIFSVYELAARARKTTVESIKLQVFRNYKQVFER